MQTYITNINRLIHNNRIENVKELISKNLYDEALLDDDYFFFNVKFDENNQPIVNTGKDDDHLHIHMTSKRLFSNIERNGPITLMELIKLHEMAFH